ncbi:ankyrin repeat and SAM domain-containing protein 6-like [Chelonus insularis]|uniref:ankyrin repeat and SAM domain-containing protein 6-like n=1 Tax=Chelonus insularis TaxID=460826 RepID=UPI00158B6EB8|nr:ankyrin repeat and SAM domain-containing protein 6-like [Chelonus insularis]
MSEIMDLLYKDSLKTNQWNDIILEEPKNLQHQQDHENKCDPKIKGIINLESTMMDIKEFENYSKVADIFNSPSRLQSIVPDKNNNHSYSALLQSPDRKELSFKVMGNYSLPMIQEDGDDPAPTTSTPEHKRNKSFQPKYKLHRPPDLSFELVDDEQDCNNFVDVTKCSPVKSPFPSSDELDDSLLGLDDTLLPISYDSPPTKILRTNSRDKKLMNLLQHFGLSHLALLFMEQEVDVDLFLTLTDNDLKEIGIEKKTDRNIILTVIAECNRRFKPIQLYNNEFN